MKRTALILLSFAIWSHLWGQHTLPVPTPAQLTWQDAELAALVWFDGVAVSLARFFFYIPVLSDAPLCRKGGHKYITRFESVKVSSLRLLIKESLKEPLTREFSAYRLEI